MKVYFSSTKESEFMVGCRKTIGFDACFFKTVLGGTLLAHVAKDCNNKMYPIAWVVVENENEDSLTWFFNILFEELNIGDVFGWTFMNDKQKVLFNIIYYDFFLFETNIYIYFFFFFYLQGLINAIVNLTPKHCARYIYANLSKSFCGTKYRDLKSKQEL